MMVHTMGPQVDANVDKTSARVAARTRVAAAAHRPPPRQEPAAVTSNSDDDTGGGQLAAVIPFGVFDADAEAARVRTVEWTRGVDYGGRHRVTAALTEPFTDL